MFLGGILDLEKEASARWRDGRPKLTQTGENIVPVAADLGKNDCQTASRMMAGCLNIPKTVVLQILKRIWEGQYF
jgi:hypothetical protein